MKMNKYQLRVNKMGEKYKDTKETNENENKNQIK